MPLPPLLLLWLGLGSFVPGSRCGSPRHSLCHSYLKVSEPSQGLPQFLSMLHLDDQPIARYDNQTSRMEPLVPWMGAEEAMMLMGPERIFRADLEWLSKLSQQTEGLHTWQLVLGCELREDGSKGGFLHFGYDGMDFISFDKETLRWVTAQPQAQKVKEKWEDDPRRSQRNKVYLEETCIQKMQKYLSYQKEALKKTEPPVGKVNSKVVDERLEVLTCQAFGFYPKEIQAIWTRDGEPCVYETLRRNVAPNSDGTFYVQLSIEIDPKERDRFRCHLEHKGLQEPLDLALNEETGWWRRRRNNLYQEVRTWHLPQINLSSSTGATEDELPSQILPLTKITSEHKASSGLKRRWSDPEITASSLHRQEGKEHPVWKTWTHYPEVKSRIRLTLSLNQLNPSKTTKDLATPEGKSGFIYNIQRASM